MGKRNLAISMNALVLPGSGHVLLGMKVKGYIISAATILLIVIPVALYISKVYTKMRELTMHGQFYHPVTRALSESWTAEKGVIITCLLLVAAVWVYSIADIYFRKEEAR